MATASGTPKAFKKIDTASSGDQTIVAGVAGKTIRIYDMVWRASGTVNVTLKDGAGTNLEGVHNCIQGDGIVYDEKTSGEPHFILASGNAFILNLSGATQVSGHLWYTQEA